MATRKSPRPMKVQPSSHPDAEPYLVSSVESDAKRGARRAGMPIPSQIATRLRKRSLKIQRARQAQISAKRK
jgi:hypothetical protein